MIIYNSWKQSQITALARRYLRFTQAQRNRGYQTHRILEKFIQPFPVKPNRHRRLRLKGLQRKLARNKVEKDREVPTLASMMTFFRSLRTQNTMECSK